MRFANIAPAIGIAVRLTTSIGDTFAMPDTATITAVMGDTLRAILEANCIGKSIATGAIAIFPATTGARAAKAKNGALPDPMMIADTDMIAVITTVMAPPPRPKD